MRTFIHTGPSTYRGRVQCTFCTPSLRLCSEAMTADNGEPRSFTLCEKKHEWICSNASTSLKNPLLV